jgi:hypothetical protein
MPRFDCTDNECWREGGKTAVDKRLRKEIEEILRRKGVKPDGRDENRLVTKRTLSRSEQELIKSVAKTTARLFAEVLREGLGGNEGQFIHNNRRGKTRVHRRPGDVQEWRICLSIEGCRPLPARRRHYGVQ